MPDPTDRAEVRDLDAGNQTAATDTSDSRSLLKLTLHPRARFVAAALVALPILGAIVAVVGADWNPTSDQAPLYVKTLGVFGGDIPLTGPYSRTGWEHPGPLLFWVSAPFVEVIGTTGMLVAAGLVNIAGGVGAVLAAWRRGGPVLGWVVAAVTLVVVSAMGPATVIDPWNPWLVPLPLLAYLLCAWGASEGDGPLLVGAVVAGSWCAQLHIGAIPVVVGAGILAAVLYLTDRRSNEHLGGWWMVGALLAGLVLWTGPLIDQFTDTANLTDVWEWQFETDEDPIGWERAVGIAGVQFGAPAAWMGAVELDAGFPRTTGFTSAAVMLTVAGAAFAVAAWRRLRSQAVLLGMCLAMTALSMFAIARIAGLVGIYLVRWTWPVAALTLAATVWALTSAIERRMLTDVVTAVAVGTVVALSLAATVDAVGTDVPFARESQATGALLAGIEEHLDPEQPYDITWLDRRSFGAVSAGVVAGLVGRGYTLDVPEAWAHSFDRERVDDPDARMIVVVGGIDSPGWEPPDGALKLATFDPLTEEQRSEADALEVILRDRYDIAPTEAVDVMNAALLVTEYPDDTEAARLHELQRLGDQFSIWLLAPNQPGS